MCTCVCICVSTYTQLQMELRSVMCPVESRTNVCVSVCKYILLRMLDVTIISARTAPFVNGRAVQKRGAEELSLPKVSKPVYMCII